MSHSCTKNCQNSAPWRALRPRDQHARSHSLGPETDSCILQSWTMEQSWWMECNDDLHSGIIMKNYVLIINHETYIFSRMSVWSWWPTHWAWNCNRCKWLRRLERCWTKSTDEPKRGQARLPSAVEKNIACHRRMRIAMGCKGQTSNQTCTFTFRMQGIAQAEVRGLFWCWLIYQHTVH